MTGLRRLGALGLIAPLALAMALVLPAVGLAAAAVTYTKESLPAYEKQLKAGEIESVTINKLLRSVHVKTKNGELFIYRYPKKGEPATVSVLAAHHVPVTILEHSEAVKEVKHKHKLRYIAGGILIVVILIVGAFLLVNRQRKRDD
jgi:hypothetical protein